MIYITGDTHAHFDQLTNRMEHAGISEGDTAIVCGDFGFTLGRDFDEMHLNAMELLPYTITFVDGNHENFDYLYQFPVVDFCSGKAHQMRKNVFHLMRGESFIIEGHSFFCFGGAYSRDKATRPPEFWWPQELPNNEEYAHARQTLEGLDYKVDYVITHTIPDSFIHRIGAIPDAHDAELTGYFEWLYRELDFMKWFAGHFHENRDFGDFMILFDEVVKL